MVAAWRAGVKSGDGRAVKDRGGIYRRRWAATSWHRRRRVAAALLPAYSRLVLRGCTVASSRSTLTRVPCLLRLTVALPAAGAYHMRSARVFKRMRGYVCGIALSRMPPFATTPLL